MDVPGAGLDEAGAAERPEPDAARAAAQLRARDGAVDVDVGAAGPDGQRSCRRDDDADVEAGVAAEEAAAGLGGDDAEPVAVLLDADPVGVAAGDLDVGLGGVGGDTCTEPLPIST